MTFKFIMLMIYLPLITNMHCAETKHEIHGSNITLDLASLCPYNRFCRSSPLKDNLRSDQMPCCEKCSCDLSCHETGSCCPDMPLVGIVEPKYPCIHVSEFGYQVDKFIFDIDEKLLFNVVTDCSENFKDSDFPRCFQPRELQDYVIVSDQTTRRIYRNKHCAKCNDVRNYVEWKLRANCLYSNFVNLRSIEERDRYLMENCLIYSFPPQARAGDISYCVADSDVIAKCNSTGEWDFYDKEIEEACLENREDQNTLFTKDVDTERDLYKTYASVYCYLCNTAKRSQKTDVCKNRIIGIHPRSGRVSLSAILDYRIWERKTEIQNTRCKSTEIWDPFMEICRPLICQAGNIPVQGNCKELFSNLDGYSIAIHFEVIFRIKSMPVNRYSLQLLKNRVFWELGTDLKCGDCLSSLLKEKNSSNPLFLRLELYSTEECPHDLLLQRIRTIAVKKEIYLAYKYQGAQVKIALKLVFEDIKTERGDLFQLLVQSLSRFCGSLNLIDSSIAQYCPRITLSRTEANNLGIYNVTQNSNVSSDQANHTNAEFQEVCVDAYFQAQQLRSGSAAVDIGHINSIRLKFLLITVFLFCLRP